MSTSPIVQISTVGSYTLNSGYSDYVVDCASGNISLTLPTIIASGSVINITRNDSGITGGILTISAALTQKINRQSINIDQANQTELRFVSYITTIDSGWFYGVSSPKLYTIETLPFTFPAIATVSPTIDISNIISYDYNNLPVGTLANGVPGKAKNFILNNDKVAPIQITTTRGSFTLSNQDVDKTQLVFNGQYWDQLAGDSLAWYPTQQQGAKIGGNTGNRQGQAVSLSADGNTLAIGAQGSAGNTGATLVFIRNGSPGVWSQQQLLGGTGDTGSTRQGTSVSLSADGNTLAVGAPGAVGNTGATWVFTRNIGVWSQQQLLGGTGNTGTSGQGQAVSLSADGNTLAVGSPGGVGSSGGVGSTWVFTRNSGVWNQQQLLSGTGNIGPSGQGQAVSLSADGNTLASGAIGDDNNIGATWVFTRSGSPGVWVQQQKLVGTGISGITGSIIFQGRSVSLSADGNTLAVGAPGDGTSVGATWLFTRNGSVWSQQQKLVGTGFSSTSLQGRSVSLSANGKTLVVGGPGDNINDGAAWLFTQSGGVWKQQGSKVIGIGNIGSSNQGNSVSLSANANTLAIGGPSDNTNAGAAWVFV